MWAHRPRSWILPPSRTWSRTTPRDGTHPGVSTAVGRQSGLHEIGRWASILWSAWRRVARIRVRTRGAVHEASTTPTSAKTRNPHDHRADDFSACTGQQTIRKEAKLRRGRGDAPSPPTRPPTSLRKHRNAHPHHQSATYRTNLIRATQ